MTKKLNTNLHKAKQVKNDEFYTQLSDIEKELLHYRRHFKNKIIFCNCDDPLESNFWKYFYLNFKFLGLKKLISTHYEKEKSSYRLECILSGNELIETRTEMQENGDFRSQECIELLKESDTVVTNPPFSLFREYVNQLIEYDKKFLIIGNMNAITYKEIFKLIKENKIWLGNTSPKQFKQPDGNIKTFGNVIWFTNLTHKKRNEYMILYKKYSEKEYPKYDNYDAIEINKVSDIPKDYDGNIGVPITFLGKYNPEQFEIICNDYSIKETNIIELINQNWKGKIDRGYINNKRLYSRIIIKNKNPQINKD